MEVAPLQRNHTPVISFLPAAFRSIFPAIFTTTEQYIGSLAQHVFLKLFLLLKYLHAGRFHAQESFLIAFNQIEVSVSII